MEFLNTLEQTSKMVAISVMVFETLHQTNFQIFLERYFGFRKPIATCMLNFVNHSKLYSFHCFLSEK